MDKKLLIPLLSCAILLTSSAKAQQFINGSFEPNKGLSACSDIDVKVYNPNMGSNWSVGTATTMQIANSSCGLGSIPQGSYFGVMKYAPPSDGNRIVFKLDKPLVANKQYLFSLNYKVPTGAPMATGGIRFGYSSDSTKTDSISGFTDPIANTAWVKDTITFTPKQPWQFVWIEVTALGGDPFTVHIDDVKMLIDPSSINTHSINAPELKVIPNPFTDHALLTVDVAVKLPYSLTVYDVTGKLVMQKAEINERSVVIDQASVGTGLYILRVTDAAQHVSTTRIAVR